MKILIYGAGVIGSVYAARLQAAGYDVSLLARGQRAVSLRAQGIILENASTGERTTTRVAIVDQLAPTDRYDVVIVTVRLGQLTEILPVLAANQQIPTILFLLNIPTGMESLALLEPCRVLLGFPSIGGSRQGDVIRYSHHPALAQTMLGKEAGQITPRLQHLATAFKKAGLSVALHDDVPSWLKTHAITSVAMVAAVAMTQGSSAKLGRTRKHVVLMVGAIREGLLVLQAQGTPITPLSMKVLFVWLPRWLAVLSLQYILRAGIAAPDLQAELDEARQVARELLPDLQKSSLPTATLRRLLVFLETPS